MITYTKGKARATDKAEEEESDFNISQLYAQGSNLLPHDLCPPSDFSPEEQSAFSMIFLRYRNLSVTSESALAAADCYELTILGQRQMKKTVVSSEAVYLCSPDHLPNVSWRRGLKDIFLISLSDTRSSAVFHTDSPGTDVWLAGTHLEDLLKVIEMAHFENTKSYIPAETVTQRGDLRYRINNLDPEMKAIARSKTALWTALVTTRYGCIGENRCFSKECRSERDGIRRKCVFLLTDKAIYTLYPREVERIPLSEITGTRFANGKVVIVTEKLKRTWKLPANVLDEVGKLREICLPKRVLAGISQ